MFRFLSGLRPLISPRMSVTVKCKEPPEKRFTDGGRWEGEVIGEGTRTFEWGTHEFEVNMQLFADGEGHMRVMAPGTPPLCASEIVADWLEAGPAYRQAAGLLAEGWGIDIEEVSD